MWFRKNQERKSPAHSARHIEKCLHDKLMEHRKFNTVYNELVSGEDDILGHIAYSVYKNQKLYEIDRFKEQHDGRAPTDEEMEPFLTFSRSPTQVSFYKERAVSLSQVFLNEAIGEQLEEAKESLKGDFLKIESPEGADLNGQDFFSVRLN
jgi:hypothetical protein